MLESQNLETVVGSVSEKKTTEKKVDQSKIDLHKSKIQQKEKETKQQELSPEAILFWSEIRQDFGIDESQKTNFEKYFLSVQQKFSDKIIP